METIDEVIVYHSKRLHVGIRDRRTQETESAMLKVLAERIGFDNVTLLQLRGAAVTPDSSAAAAADHNHAAGDHPCHDHQDGTRCRLVILKVVVVVVVADARIPIPVSLKNRFNVI